MEMIEEEQVYKETKQERINKEFADKQKSISLPGCKYETQSLLELNQQRLVGFLSEDQLTLKNKAYEFQSSSYLQVKKNQLFKKYSSNTSKSICYKFQTNFKNLLCKAESLKNQIKVDKITFNKPRSQEQIDNRLIRERTISSSDLRSKFFENHEITPQNFKNSTSVQSQKLSSQIKNQTTRRAGIDNYRKLQNILNKKQKELSFIKNDKDKSNPIKNQIRQRLLIVRVVTYIIFLVVFACIKIALDKFF